MRTSIFLVMFDVPLDSSTLALISPFQAVGLVVDCIRNYVLHGMDDRRQSIIPLPSSRPASARAMTFTLRFGTVIFRIEFVVPASVVASFAACLLAPLP